MAEILFENDDFLIADKRKGIPTVPLKTQGMEGTLLGEVALARPMILDVKGKNPWEYGALHRLDTPTSGLVVFAKTQRFYDYLSQVQNNGSFIKTYIAKTIANDALKGIDIPDNCSDYLISSYFRAFGPKGSQVRPTLDPKRADTPQVYETIVTVLSSDDRTTTYKCMISKGFRHQIRAHLAWCGHPILGDGTYNGNAGDLADQDLHLDCIEVSFPLSDGKPFLFSKTASDAII